MEISEELKQKGVLENVKQSYVRWREALAEMGPERLVRRVYEVEEGSQGENVKIILNNDMFMLYNYLSNNLFLWLL